MIFRLEGVKSIPSFYTNRAKRFYWAHLVAYHYHLDPDIVKSWDNDAILEAVASLKIMGVVK